MMREVEFLEAPVKPGEVSACVGGGTKERMPRVCKAVIKVKGGYFEESQI